MKSCFLLGSTKVGSLNDLSLLFRVEKNNNETSVSIELGKKVKNT